MKYLKDYKIFENQEDIHSICKKYGIRNYTINTDGSIDVDGDVHLYNRDLTKLPLNFRNISGYFDCSWNKLTSLEGAPVSVGGYFDFDNNPVYSVIRTWINIKSRRWELMEYFEEMNVIQGDRVILPRLIAFSEDMNVEIPDIKEIEKYYKIIG